MARFEKWLKADLNILPRVERLKDTEFSQDVEANLIGVEVKRGGVDVALSGTVKGYIITPAGTTLAVNGSISGNKASIVLPEDAYETPGYTRISIKLLDGDDITTLAACEAMIVRSRTSIVG